jgi:hypothetical protein
VRDPTVARASTCFAVFRDADTLDTDVVVTAPKLFRRGAAGAPSPAGTEFASSLFDYASPGAASRERALTFLGDRDEHEWEVMLAFTELRRFWAGEVIVRRGDGERALYLLTAGSLEVRANDRDEAFKTIDAPSVVGEIAFLDGGSRTADLVAATAGEVRRMSLERFEALSARHPELGRAVLFDLGRIAATRLRWMMDAAARGE